MPERSMLISGASGFLGGALYQKAVHLWRVTALCHSTSMPGMMPVDLTDTDKVHTTVRTVKPRVILHLAANANLDVCEKDPQQAHAVNTAATATLLQAADDIGARLIFVSTDMVFDGRQGNYHELDPVAPLSVYGHTKVAAEKLLLASKGPHVVARAALIYGRPRLGGSSFSEWIEKRLQARQPVSLYRDQFRTPVWVENLADQLLELAANDYCGILHCAGSERIDRLEFGRILCEKAGYDAHLLIPSSMHDHATTAPRPVDVSLNVELAGQVLHTPLLSVEEGISHMTGKA